MQNNTNNKPKRLRSQQIGLRMSEREKILLDSICEELEVSRVDAIVHMMKQYINNK